MKRLAVLASLVAVPAVVLGAANADGCPPSTCGTTSAAIPGSRYLFVRPAGQSGPLAIYDLVRRRELRMLPAGLLSANGRVFVAARARKRELVLTRYGLPDARVLGRHAVAGRGDLVVISRSGALAVLNVRAPRRTTAFLVVDVVRGRALRGVRLRGPYEAETLSFDGRRLFLVHWRRHGYRLEVLDLRTGRLRETPLAAEEKGEKMTGTAARAVATRNGRWLLTLYLSDEGGFVHALDLRRGVGHCVDLPLARAAGLRLDASALALSPDEQRLYVASPLLGRLFVVDLRRPRVAQTVRFAPLAGKRYTFGIGPVAAASRNGRMLYFGAGPFVWAYDAAYARVRGPYRVGEAVSRNALAAQSVAGLGVSPDGRRVVTLRGDRAVVVLDAASGSRVS